MRFAAFAAGMLLVTACDADTEHHAYQRERPLSGSFTEHIDYVQRSPRRDACEANFAQLQRDVAQALDARRDMVERFFLERGIETEAKTVTSASGASRLPLGPSMLVSLPPQIASSPTQVYHHGWQLIDEWYAETRNEGQDLARNWAILHALTQGIISDDVTRMRGLSMGLDGDSLDQVRALRDLLDNCVAERACTSVALPDDIATYVRSHNLVYAKLASDIDAVDNHALKRQKIREWARQVDIDAGFYGFEVNETISAEASTGVLHVPLQAGDYAGAESMLASIIEGTWRNDAVQVRVRWVDASVEPKAYRFVSHAHQGNGRAFVDHGMRTINFFAEVTPKTVAHELGHVLGLSDHYYTRWDPTLCQYDVQVDNRDIMSNHEAGSVTDSEWREIREHYDF